MVSYLIFLPVNLYALVISPIRATHHTNLISLELIILIIFGEGYNLRSSSICSFLHPHVAPSVYVRSFFKARNLLFTAVQNSR